MVIAGRDVCHERPEYIERRAHADALLDFHVCGNLIQRDMSRSFHHDLDIVVPGAFCQFPETDELFDLTDVRGVRQTAGPAGVSQGDRDVIFLADIQDLVKVFVKRILLSGHAHPGKDEASSAAYDVHFSLVLLDLFNGLARDAAVQRHKVHAVLRVQADNVNKIFGGECGEISLIVDHAVIDRHRTDHDRAFSRQLLAEGLCVPMAGEVHDRLSSQINSAHHLLHLNVIVLAVS